MINTKGLGEGADIAAALRLAGKRGKVVVTNLHNAAEATVAMSALDLVLMEKQVRGSLFGSSNPRADIPRMLDLYRNGKLKLDELATHRYKLEEVNQGYDDMRAGRSLRGVITFLPPQSDAANLRSSDAWLTPAACRASCGCWRTRRRRPWRRSCADSSTSNASSDHRGADYLAVVRVRELVDAAGGGSRRSPSCTPRPDSPRCAGSTRRWRASSAAPTTSSTPTSPT